MQWTEEMRRWLLDRNAVDCRDLEERERLFQICEEMGFPRGFQNTEHKDKYRMHLGKFSTGEIHASAVGREYDAIPFSEWIRMGEQEILEVQDPGLLYIM